MADYSISYHPQYVANQKIWKLCKDASTPMAVKFAGADYLPMAENQQDDDPNSSMSRYQKFKQRAVFYGFTQETISGLMGLAFRQGITFESDASLDYIATNIDGDGVGLEQQAKAAMRDLIMYGRGGLFVDHPSTGGQISKADQERLRLSTTVNLYDAFSITDWATMRVGSSSVLSMVNLIETQYIMNSSGDTEAVCVERRLELDEDGLYFVQESVDGVVIEGRRYEPTNSAGQRLDYIPFYFFGAVNNDINVDDAPIFPIADLNIAHYRNSADYENTSWLIGQPQPWASGLTQSWVDQNMNGFSLGSGVLMVLPEGGSFGIAQVQPNSMAMEGMLHKQQAMIAMGAKLITSESSFNTATEATIATASENSRLQTGMDNIEAAYAAAFEALADFMGKTAPVFTINTDLASILINADMVRAATESWMQGLTGKTDARMVQRKAGIIERSDEEIDADVDDNVIGLAGE